MPNGNSLLHILSPIPDNSQGIRKIHAVGSDQGGVLAETVTGYRDGPETGRFQESQGRDAGCEQGGLSVFRQIQAFGRSVEA